MMLLPSKLGNRREEFAFQNLLTHSFSSISAQNFSGNLHFLLVLLSNLQIFCEMLAKTPGIVVEYTCPEKIWKGLVSPKSKSSHNE